MRQYDFYYSKKAAAWYQELHESNQDENICDKITLFKGREYTEMITSGEPPVSNWDDAVLLGTGTHDDITYKERI